MTQTFEEAKAWAKAMQVEADILTTWQPETPLTRRRKMPDKTLKEKMAELERVNEAKRNALKVAMERVLDVNIKLTAAQKAVALRREELDLSTSRMLNFRKNYLET